MSTYSILGNISANHLRIQGFSDEGSEMILGSLSIRGARQADYKRRCPRPHTVILNFSHPFSRSCQNLSQWPPSPRFLPMFRPPSRILDVPRQESVIRHRMAASYSARVSAMRPRLEAMRLTPPCRTRGPSGTSEPRARWQTRLWIPRLARERILVPKHC